MATGRYHSISELMERASIEFAVWQKEENPYEADSMKKEFHDQLTVKYNSYLGGDIEANCCIVGGIIGPIFGMSNFGKHFFSSLESIPSKRYIYSIALMVPYIIYLKKSNKDIKLIQNERYFLQTILTLLYDKIELDFS